MDIHVLRRKVYLDTKEKASSFPMKPSQKFIYDSLYIFPVIYPYTTIEVTREDTIVAGLRLKQQGFNPLLLNFADNKIPGGGVEIGCGAQEESLFRRTNLCVSCTRDMYPICDNEAIYSPVISVFKDTELNEYTPINPVQLSFIAAPGLNHPHLENGKLTKAQQRYFHEKIRLVFQIGKQQGHDTLVLGPLGCGSWRCPPDDVAMIFKQLCITYNGVFTKIVFACYSRPEIPDSNYDIFHKVFNNYV